MKGKKALFDFRKQDFDALLFDLDGVITKTAQAHARSWKRLFDEYLKNKDNISEQERRPFDTGYDYLTFVDGKPRYEGVKSFLGSRGISLPYGHPEDPADADTVCGLGNLKNIYFNDQLKREGVEVHRGSRELLTLLKQKGFKTGVVTSSRNCSTVLKAASLEDLFDVQVDGLVSAHLGLRGKPSPDTFLEAARMLHSDPTRTVIFEDALAGIEAGRAGDFGCVIGVDHTGHGKELEKKGAHLVVSDLSTLSVEGEIPPFTMPIGTIPGAMDNLEELMEEVRKFDLFLALDYDGTLTPIVERPELALLSKNMRSILEKLADRFRVAIITGRDLQDIKDLVKLDNIIYAGSHGFDILSPGNSDLQFQMGNEFLPILDRIQKTLEKEIASIEGALLERKKFSIALHYRLVPRDRTGEVKTLVDRILEEEPRLKKGEGKMVFELKPDLDWDKGKALLWLMEGTGMSPDRTLPLYIGDDITDEDAFRILQGMGMGIVVRDSEDQRLSMAGYSLENTSEVEAFLETLLETRIKGGNP